MKVTQIRSFSVQDEGGRGYMIVRVDTDAGHHGLGEVGIRNWGRAINEAIDLAKYFSSSESGRFVNGVLDRVRKELAASVSGDQT